MQSAKEELSEEDEEYVKWMDSFQPNMRKYYCDAPIPGVR